MLVTYRKKNLLTQKDMAKKLNISVTSYQLKESGIRQFTIDEIYEILDILNLSFEDIFLPNMSHNNAT